MKSESIQEISGNMNFKARLCAYPFVLKCLFGRRGTPLLAAVS